MEMEPLLAAPQSFVVEIQIKGIKDKALRGLHTGVDSHAPAARARDGCAPQTPTLDGFLRRTCLLYVRPVPRETFRIFLQFFSDFFTAFLGLPRPRTTILGPREGDRPSCPSGAGCSRQTRGRSYETSGAYTGRDMRGQHRVQCHRAAVALCPPTIHQAHDRAADRHSGPESPHVGHGAR